MDAEDELRVLSTRTGSLLICWIMGKYPSIDKNVDREVVDASTTIHDHKSAKVNYFTLISSAFHVNADSCCIIFTQVKGICCWNGESVIRPQTSAGSVGIKHLPCFITQERPAAILLNLKNLLSRLSRFSNSNCWKWVGKMHNYLKKSWGYAFSTCPSPTVQVRFRF